MLRDLISNVAMTMALKAQVITADQNGASMDLVDHKALAIMANVGASGDTLSGSVKLELHVQESDDNSNWTQVADADLTASVSGSQVGTFAVIDDAAEDEAIYKVGYRGQKRYVRACVNAVGTHTNGTPVSMAYLSSPLHVPAA